MKWTALVLAVLGTAAMTVQAQQRPFRTNVDLVRFNVLVTDRSGMPVSGLKAEDFEVIEDGKAQALKVFAGGSPADAPPVHLAFMIDSSGSMLHDLKEVQTAAIKFLNAVEKVIDVTLVDFDTEVRVARFNPDDFPRMIERIRNRKPDGYTALYDAVGVYLDGAFSQDGDKIMVLYTDGGDTRSSMRQMELLDLLKASDVTVYTLGYLRHQGSGKLEQQQILTRVAQTTGGLSFFPTAVKDLDKMYDQILKEIASRYSLGYVSLNETKDGAWRDVKIRLVNKPEFKNVKIRTRAGYYAPYRPTQ